MEERRLGSTTVVFAFRQSGKPIKYECLPRFEKAFTTLVLQRFSGSDISLQVERKATAHLLPLLLVLDLFLPAVWAPVGACLTSKLVSAVPANIYRNFLHLNRSLCIIIYIVNIRNN